MTSFSQRDIQDSDDQESLDASPEEESGLKRKSQGEYLPVKKPKILNHFRDI